MVRPIKTAVFPVAGLGTRFLPATKAMPKEMLTVVDRPVIQLAVDEAREAGIEHFVFVTGRGKAVIEDHFDKQFELEATLKAARQVGGTRSAGTGPAQGRPGQLHPPAGTAGAGPCRVVRAPDRRRRALRPAAARHGDACQPGCLKQMIDVYETHGGGNVVAVEEVPWDQVSRYGVVGAKDWQDNAFTITGMVEKPKRREDAPSNLIISGRYILQPEIFAEIESQEPGAGGEIQITDAMIRLMARAALPRPQVSRARPMTAATRSASSPPTWPWRSNAPMWAPASGTRCGRSSENSAL